MVEGSGLSIGEIGGIVAQLSILGLTALYLRGKTDGGESKAISDLAQSNGRVADTLEKLDARYRDHELDCSRWRATTDQVLKQMSENQSRMVAVQEDLSRRISNMAMGVAPEPEARVVPRSRGR